MALTGKKRAFADAVLAGFSNKEAAIRAGYSPATAAQSGSRLRKDPDVSAHVEKCNQADAQAPAPPPSPPELPDDFIDIPPTADPIAFLTTVMNDPGAELRYRMDAAKAMLPFKHKKLGEGGKKDDAADKAKKVGAGKFAAAAPPKLVVNNKQ